MKQMLRIAALSLLALTGWAQNRQEQKISQELGAHEITLHGVLIDAGCPDRSLWNMTRPPEAQAASMAPMGPTTAGQATRDGQAAQSEGISVDSKTIGLERQDVTMVMNPDLSARQTDPTCAIKANTRSYALLLRDGRLLDLDDGANTLATAAVQSSRAGRQMINGRGPGFKPVVTIVGRVHGDRFFGDQLRMDK